LAWFIISAFCFCRTFAHPAIIPQFPIRCSTLFVGTKRGDALRRNKERRERETCHQSPKLHLLDSVALLRFVIGALYCGLTLLIPSFFRHRCSRHHRSDIEVCSWKKNHGELSLRSKDRMPNRKNLTIYPNYQKDTAFSGSWVSLSLLFVARS
jgi:hypothetical protein